MQKKSFDPITLFIAKQLDYVVILGCMLGIVCYPVACNIVSCVKRSWTLLPNCNIYNICYGNCKYTKEPAKIIDYKC